MAARLGPVLIESASIVQEESLQGVVCLDFVAKSDVKSLFPIIDPKFIMTFELSKAHTRVLRTNFPTEL